MSDHPWNCICGGRGTMEEGPAGATYSMPCPGPPEHIDRHGKRYYRPPDVEGKASLSVTVKNGPGLMWSGGGYTTEEAQDALVWFTSTQLGCKVIKLENLLRWMEVHDPAQRGFTAADLRDAWKKGDL